MSRVKDIDLGFRAITGRIKSMHGKAVEIGLDGENATKGTHNEFGAPKAKVPERSFMRSSHDENEDTYAEILAEGARRVIDGTAPVENGLHRAGIHAQADQKRKIVSLREPANADSTIARKGSSNPLIDDADMLGAVKYELTKGGK